MSRFGLDDSEKLPIIVGDDGTDGFLTAVEDLITLVHLTADQAKMQAFLQLSAILHPSDDFLTKITSLIETDAIHNMQVEHLRQVLHIWKSPGVAAWAE